MLVLVYPLRIPQYFNIACKVVFSSWYTMSRAAQRARLVTEIAGRGKYPAFPTGHREPKQQAGWPSLAGSIILIFIILLKAVQQQWIV